MALAERLALPVWQEPFGGRAGFPQDHRLFAGHLHWSRGGCRSAGGARPRAGHRHERVPAATSTTTRPWCAGARTSRCSPRTPPRRIAARARWRWWRRWPAACRALAERSAQREPEPPATDSTTAAAATARRGRAAARRPRARRARGAAAARGGAARRVAVEPARAPPSGSPPGRRWASSAAPTAASGSACRGRSGCGWASRTDPSWRDRRRLLDVRDPVAVERGALRGRRAADRDGQRTLRGDGRAGARSRRRGRLAPFESIDIAGISRCFGCPAGGVADLRGAAADARRGHSGAGVGREPLLVEVALAPG